MNHSINKDYTKVTDMIKIYVLTMFDFDGYPDASILDTACEVLNTGTFYKTREDAENAAAEEYELATGDDSALVWIDGEAGDTDSIMFKIREIEL